MKEGDSDGYENGLLNRDPARDQWVRLPYPPLSSGTNSPSPYFCYTLNVSLLDFVFPKYCVNCKKLGSYLCTTCFTYISFDVKETCLICQRPAVFGLTHPKCKTGYSIDGVFSSVAYKGIVKKLVYQFKYKPYLTDLRTVLSDLFYEALIQKEEFNRVLQSKESWILVPIPISRTRERKRGYNQSEILAEELGKKFNMNVWNLLKRTKETKSQFGLSKDERKKNLAEAFALSPNISISKYPNIFLIDDILTTGSTLVETANVLKRNGAKRVFGLTLARD